MPKASLDWFQNPTSIDGRIYEEILLNIKAVFKKYFSRATAMYVDPRKKDLIGWHLLLSRDADVDKAGYFVLYETDLFPSVAQVRFLRGEYQLQYILEPENVIRLSQFRLNSEDVPLWNSEDVPL